MELEFGKTNKDLFTASLDEKYIPITIFCGDLQ